MKTSVADVASRSKEQAVELPRPAGRPRSEAARRAVLDAAYEILVAAGLGSFSVEAVASRSGVARTTVYRWWPSKGALAMESFLEAFRVQLDYPRSGSAVEDFRSFVLSLAAALAGNAGRVAASVMAQAQSDEDTRRLFLQNFSEPLRRQTAELLVNGVVTGHFRADLDVPRLIDAAVGAVYLRLLFGQSLDACWAADLVHTLLEGCHAQHT